MAAVQTIARAKHRHFRLFRWPPFNAGRLFMVQVVAAVRWLGLICGSRLSGAKKAAGHLLGMPQGCSLWCPTSHIRMWIAHSSCRRQQAGPFHPAISPFEKLCSCACVSVGWLWGRNLPHTDQGGDKDALWDCALPIQGCFGGHIHLSPR